jgi:bisphosphoglycerate-independent phosphoglycerate mutase (AlkP superfamily)
MKKTTKKQGKGMAVDKISLEIRSGFKSLEKGLIEKVDEKINSLAVITAKGFEAVDRRFDRVEKRLENLEDGQKKINNDILDIRDSYVKRSEFDNFIIRFNRLEQKVNKK